MYGSAMDRQLTVDFRDIFMTKTKKQSYISNLQTKLITKRKKDIKLWLRD